MPVSHEGRGKRPGLGGHYYLGLNSWWATRYRPSCMGLRRARPAWEDLTEALRSLLLLALNPAPMLPRVPQPQVPRLNATAG